MHYRYGIILTAAILFFASATHAQDIQSMRYLNMIVSGGTLRFRVVSGRISFDDQHAGFIQYASTNEQISIQPSDGGDSTFTYNWTGGKRQFSVEATGKTKIRIRLSSNGDNSVIPVEFQQPLRGKIVLKVGSEGKQSTYSASNLWLLLLAYPAETKQHLAPLLKFLRPNWRLSETAAALETELLRKADANETFDRKRWDALIAQLGDDIFAKRQAADRALRAGDLTVLNYLQQFDLGRLDAEQHFRMKRIVQDLTERMGEDSPEQTASWLSGDPAAWLVFLSRPEAEIRRQAARQLTAILGGPIPVDPQADPSTQKKQLDQLRARIEGPPADDK
jgi:hypothetical protein